MDQTGLVHRAGEGGPTPHVRAPRRARVHDRLTAMPVTGIGEAEARDVAAYLYTLR